jgi:hypothetical protein
VSERAESRPQGVQQDVGRALQNGFYPGPASSSGEPLQEVSKRDAKPSHYKVICISMYTDDLKRLDGMVEALKARGLTKANRSALIRYALGEVDLDRVPKGL